MTERMKDRRSQVDITHDPASLIRTSVLLAAQGWRDHDDADAFRHDPAFRLAASSSAGLTPLGGPGLREAAAGIDPDALAEQAAALGAASRNV